jgi:hypothetical protein
MKQHNNNNNNNNKTQNKILYISFTIQFFIMYMQSQQLQGQLQTPRSVDTSNYIMDKHNIKTTTT